MYIVGRESDSWPGKSTLPDKVIVNGKILVHLKCTQHKVNHKMESNVTTDESKCKIEQKIYSDF